MPNYDYLIEDYTSYSDLIIHIGQHLTTLQDSEKEEIDDFIAKHQYFSNITLTQEQLLTIIIWKFKYGVDDDDRLFKSLLDVTPFSSRTNSKYNRCIAKMTTPKLNLYRLVTQVRGITIASLCEFEALTEVYTDERLIHYFMYDRDYSYNVEDVERNHSYLDTGIKLMYSYKYGDTLTVDSETTPIYNQFMQEKYPHLDAAMVEAFGNLRTDYQDLEFTCELVAEICHLNYILYEIFSYTTKHQLTCDEFATVLTNHHDLICKYINMYRESSTTITTLCVNLLLDYEGTCTYLNMGLDNASLTRLLNQEISTRRSELKQLMLNNPLWFMADVLLLKLIEFTTLGMSEHDLVKSLSLKDITYDRLYHTPTSP